MGIDVAEEGYEFPLLISRSKAYCKLGKYEEALEDITQVLSKQPKNIKAIEQEARTLYEYNEFERAMVVNITAQRERKKPDNFIVGTEVVNIHVHKYLCR